jgi:hypothetical protein
MEERTEPGSRFMFCTLGVATLTLRFQKLYNSRKWLVARYIREKIGKTSKKAYLELTGREIYCNLHEVVVSCLLVRKEDSSRLGSKKSSLKASTAGKAVATS